MEVGVEATFECRFLSRRVELLRMSVLTFELEPEHVTVDGITGARVADEIRLFDLWLVVLRTHLSDCIFMCVDYDDVRLQGSVQL